MRLASLPERGPKTVVLRLTDAQAETLYRIVKDDLARLPDPEETGPESVRRVMRQARDHVAGILADLDAAMEEAEV